MTQFESTILVTNIIGLAIALGGVIFVAIQSVIQTKIQKVQRNEIQVRNREKENERYIVTVDYLNNPVITKFLSKIKDISESLDQRIGKLESDFGVPIENLKKRAVEMLPQCLEIAYQLKCQIYTARGFARYAYIFVDFYDILKQYSLLKEPLKRGMGTIDDLTLMVTELRKIKPHDIIE